MKRSLKIIMMIGCIFLLTGCVKYNAIMDIKKDKSMDFSIIYAVDTSVFGDQEIYKEADKKELEKQGFTIEDYHKDNMKGYNIKINILNIDKVSSNEGIVYNLTNATKNNKKENKIFTLKKGIFKNTYKANLKFDSADSELNNTTTTKDDTTEDNTTDYNTDSSENTGDWDELTNTLTNSASNLDLSFKVNLPYSAINNNATQTSNNNKELVWTLTSNEASNIEFEFSLYNRINIIIASVALILIVIVVVIAIINSKKKNNTGTTTNNSIEKLNINTEKENNNDANNVQTINDLDQSTNIENQNINNSIFENLPQEQSGPSLTDMYSKTENINNTNTTIKENTDTLNEATNQVNITNNQNDINK